MNFTERRCVLFGRMGLRSLGTGGTWKNVTVTRATEADYRTQALYAGSPEEPEFPGREADFNHRFRLLPDTKVPNSTVSHSCIWVRADADIHAPRNLKGKRMGAAE